MKSNLSSTNIAAYDKQESVITDKSASPSSSPRSSPRPSPRPQNKRDHSKSDSLLTVNYNKEAPNAKQDGSPSSQDSGSKVSNLEVTPPLQENKLDTVSTSGKDRRNKKKSWFNFYPTYKTKSESFKRIFKDVPDDERLIVDYACALQKEILLQGRLYITQNYLCFYANIFGWETVLTSKWKEVTAITKEKTALVIPNAILICTKQDKCFFASFVARDKAYLMLFRVWQNALMDQPMSPQEMWQWVHQCYGSELGLTSDDEDYIAPVDEDKLSARLSVESFSEDITSCLGIEASGSVNSDQSVGMPSRTEQSALEDQGSQPSISTRLGSTSDPRIAGQFTPDFTDSDEEQQGLELSTCCTSIHDGRQVLSEVVPIHIDQLFTLLFTSSKFYLDFHAARKTTDLTQTPWTHNPMDDSKSRVVNLTMALAQTVGPKSAQVTETQIMLPCSKAGELYAVDIETVNAGVPYADSFFVAVHYCLQKVSESQSSINVFAEVKYKKSVWGLVKGMIERNCYAGMEEYCVDLTKALKTESEEFIPEKKKARRKRRLHSMPRPIEDKTTLPVRKKIHPEGMFTTDVCTLIVFSVLLLLLFLNVMLYYKLWSLEEAPPYTFLDLHLFKNPPKSHEDWIKLLQQQEALHTIESQKWQKLLKNAINLLKQVNMT
ncbi:unnamed protein product [Callosobruchus maculatus]|uniref:VASt domain-containing protein n=1 Tax=Callosobruchus maculatus TaxID=64391 RepID=A0A653CB30_CALMS|nr:unnamed protein product [Callosobruchus maculatus]